MTFSDYCSMRDAQAMQVDEAFFDKLTSTFGKSYDQAKGSAEQAYEKYAPAAQKALASVGGKAKEYSAKLGIPVPLATALLAAGLTGGPAAVPFAALMYFVKKPLMKGANKVFDTAWDAASGALKPGQQPQQPGQQPQQQAQAGKFQMPSMSSGGYTSGAVQKTSTWPTGMQPVRAEHMTFREFVELMEADSWGDWAGEKLGGAAGWLAGKAAGFGGKLKSAAGNVLNALKGRAAELAQYAKNNPKEIARMAFLVGAGALIGAGVGKITHDVKDMIVQKIGDIGVPQEELAWLRSNVVLDKEVSADGSETMFSNRGGDLLTQGGKSYDSSHPFTDVGQTAAPADITAQDYIKNTANWADGASSGSDTTLSAMTSTNDLGKVGSFDAYQSYQGTQPELGDVYRDMAKQMHASGMLKNIKDLSVDPSYAPLAYGHSAGTEIANRLASPDTLTGAGAIGGAVGAAAGQVPAKPQPKKTTVDPYMAQLGRR